MELRRLILKVARCVMFIVGVVGVSGIFIGTDWRRRKLEVVRRVLSSSVFLFSLIGKLLVAF